MMNERHPTPDLLDAYVLEDLDHSARREVSAHLQVCAACCRTEKALRKMLAGYRTASFEPADEVILDRLLWIQRAWRTDFKPPLRRRLVGLGVAVAVACLIFMGGFWTGRVGDGIRAPQEMPAWSKDEQLRVSPTAPAVDLAPPPVSFAVAESDRLGHLAFRDTTWH